MTSPIPRPPAAPLLDESSIGQDGAPERAGPRVPLMNGLVSAAVIVAALYFGRDLLMPLALAVLFGFVVDPMVSWLKRRGVPRAAAVIAVVLTALTLLGAAGLLVYGQLRQIGGDLPRYETNMTRKLRTVGDVLRQPGMLAQYSRVVEKVEKEIDSAQQASQAQRPRAERPSRVEIVGQSLTPAQKLSQWADRFTTPLAMAGTVLIFAILILLDRGDLRDRLLRLLGGNLHRTTEALGEAGRRVSKYLTMQLLVNTLYGLPMAIGLLLIGVPGALMWGLLAAVLRFLPYVGPVIAAIFPLTLAFAADPGWQMVLWTLALVLSLELISNNLIEPWLYGGSTGLSTLSLILAAMFWTALWGPIGLVLSTPITVLLLVLGRHLPQLRFLEVLLGSARALDEPTRLHQRLLAGDVEEAIELATRHAEQDSLQAFYGGVGLGALRRAASAEGDMSTAEQRHRVVSGMQRVLDELRELHPVDPALPARVVCIGARGAVDALGAEMAAHLLALQGLGSRVLRVGTLTSEHLAQLELRDVQLVCLCHFSSEPGTLARYFVRRLRRRWPQLPVLLAAWGHPALPPGANPFAEAGVDATVTTVEDLVVRARSLLETDTDEFYTPAPLPPREDERLQALQASGLLAPELRGPLDATARRVADAFDCPIALVSLVDDDWQLAHGSASAVGRPGSGTPEPIAPRALSMCGHVVARGNTLVVPDVLRDARFAANPRLRQDGLRFYAGAPVCDRDGFVLGTLCLFDHQPRQLTPRDILLLESMAARVIELAQKHARQPASGADLPAGAAPA